MSADNEQAREALESEGGAVDSLRHSMIHLVDRDRRAAEQLVLARARVFFGDWEVRGEYKNPEVLLASLRRRLAASVAFGSLLSNERLSLDVIAELCWLLIRYYDDLEIPRRFPPEWQYWAAREKQLKREASSLAKVARRARRENLDQHAQKLESEAEQRRGEAENCGALRAHYERSAPPGQPLIRPGGAPRRADTAFAEHAERVLSRERAVPFGEEPSFDQPPHLLPPERYRLIAALVTDFYRLTEPEQIRNLLRDAKRRGMERRKKESSAQRESESPRSRLVGARKNDAPQDQPRSRLAREGEL